jgi:hypothetical protein
VCVGATESMSRYGIVFSGDSKISVVVDTAEKLDRETVSEIFGATLLQLSRVEEQANEALTAIGSDLDSLIEIEDEEPVAVEPRRRNRG